MGRVVVTVDIEDKHSREFDEFWDAVMVMLNPVFGLGVAVQEYQTGGRRVGVDAGVVGEEDGVEDRGDRGV